MLSLTRPTRWVLLVASLTAPGCAERVKGPWAEGRAEAQRDLAAGHLRLKTCGGGPPIPEMERYYALVERKLGVSFHHFRGGCQPDKAKLEHTDGYNGVMKPEIERRFGPGVLEALRQEAWTEQACPAWVED